MIGKYAGLYTANPDIIGWIKIKGTRINYPVMQTQNDPEFYLRRNFKKEYSVSGTPFMDAMSDIFIPTCNWTIYGHHMKDGTMFGDLKQYKEDGFRKEHRKITLESEGGISEYRIFAVARVDLTDASSFRFEELPKTPEEKELYIEGLDASSFWYDDAQAQKDGTVLLLSTCDYGSDEERLLVAAKKIE